MTDSDGDGIEYTGYWKVVTTGELDDVYIEPEEL